MPLMYISTFEVTKGYYWYTTNMYLMPFSSIIFCCLVRVSLRQLSCPSRRILATSRTMRVLCWWVVSWTQGSSTRSSLRSSVNRRRSVSPFWLGTYGQKVIGGRAWICWPANASSGGCGFLLEYTWSICWPDVVRRDSVRVSLVLLGLVLGFLVFILSVVGLVCQYP